MEVALRVIGNSEVHNGAVTNPELEDLLGAAHVKGDVVFLSWHWNDAATELLRGPLMCNPGCDCSLDHLLKEVRCPDSQLRLHRC